MRKKNHCRMQAILKVAVPVFQERGFELDALSEIAARMGETREELRAGYFTEAELFFDVVAASLEDKANEMFAAAKAADDIEQGLHELGTLYLQFILSPGIMSIFRMAAMQGGNSELTQKFYAKGPGRMLRELSEVLDCYVEKGMIQQCNTAVMAKHLRSLYESEICMERVLGLVRDVDCEETAAMVHRAVRVFLKSYATETYRW